jgi:hypothetical protein
VDAGSVIFKTEVSTVGTLNISNGSSLILDNTSQNIVDVSSLYITGIFNLQGILKINADLANLKADWIYVGGKFNVLHSSISVNAVGKFIGDIKIFTVGYDLPDDLALDLTVLEGFTLTHDLHSIYLSAPVPSFWNIFVNEWKSAGQGQSVPLEHDAFAAEEKYSFPLGKPANDDLIADGKNNFLNAYGDIDLGFILEDSSVTFINITFTSFTSQDLAGAVMAIKNSTIDFLSNINFNDNVSPNETSVGGGAVWAQNSLLNFSNSVSNFKNNTSVNGGIFVLDNSRIIFTNSNLSFTDNLAQSLGGAFYLQSSTLTFTNSQINFENNTAQALSNISFNNNAAPNETIVGGGVVWAQNSVLEFSNSVSNFRNNTSVNGGIFVLDNSRIIFTNSNLSFTNNTAQSLGGAFYLQSSTLVFANSQIDFRNNFADNNLNDIYLRGAESSVIFLGNNSLTNGINVSGDEGSQIIKTGGGRLIFSGGAIIQNTFIVESGGINFKSAVSSVSVLTMHSGSTLSLENGLGVSKLFVSTLTLQKADLVLDINFEQMQSDKIYASSVTIFSGGSIVVNKLSSYELFSKEVGIIIADDFFGLNQNGSFTNNGENIFNYDKSLYGLRFDFKSKTLYIRNVVPQDQDGAETENEEEIEEIVNEDGRLKYPISKMTDAQKRFAYDSLSGVFLTDIFTSLLYAQNEKLIMQISQTPAYKPWLNINFSNLEFDKNKQALGIFEARSLEAAAGMDVFANRIMRAGIFAGISSAVFSQANNTAGIIQAEAGVYANISLKGFNAIFLGGMKQGEGWAVREIKLEETYHPASDIFYSAFNGAAKLEYNFLIERSKRVERSGGPFVLYEFNQVNVEEIKEKEDSDEVEWDGLTSLYFGPQMKQKQTLKGGAGFKQRSGLVEFSVMVFVGQNLNGAQRFRAEFIENGGSFRVISDDENLFFYGGQAGGSLILSRQVMVGAQFGYAFNENLRNYNAGINIVYRMPPRVERPAVPELSFEENSAKLSRENLLALTRFTRQLKVAKPKFKRIVILLRLNNSRDALSIEADRLTVERANTIFRELRRLGIAKKKIVFSPRKVMLRDKIEVRVER